VTLERDGGTGVRVAKHEPTVRGAGSCQHINKEQETTKQVLQHITPQRLPPVRLASDAASDAKPQSASVVSGNSLAMSRATCMHVESSQ
jgi:hypothetical protein